MEDRDLLAADSHAVVAEGPKEPAGTTKIVGGQEATPGDWPWMAALQTARGQFCGGALVAPDVVATAAHCVEGVSRNRLSVVIGRHDLSTDEGDVFAVDEIISHPDYNTFSDDADIALITLRESSNVPWLPLVDLESEPQLSAPGTTATVLGWGVRSEGAFSSPNELHLVDVPIVANAVANRQESYRGRVTDTMLAAGRRQGGVDSCQGDSGGPLVVQDDEGAYHLTGIVSWGDGCARPAKYGIYARVPYFAEWIRDNSQVDFSAAVNFAQDRYTENDVATISLRDADLIGAQSVELLVSSSSGDEQRVTLTETRPGRLFGTVQLAPGAPTADNGLLEVVGGGRVFASYADPDDGNGNPLVVEDTVRIVADDHGNSPVNATHVDAASRATGEIELGGDEDWFALDAEQGQAYQFDVRLNGSLNDSVLSLYNDDGTLLLGSDDDGGGGLASRFVWQANSTERVHLVVQGYGNNVGTYELLLSSSESFNDDHGNAALDATAIAIGDTADGLIETETDSDWFAMTLEVGATYEFATELGTLGDTTLSIVAEDGETEIEFDDDSGNDLASRIVWTSEYDGVVYARVQGFDGRVGSYQVTVTQLSFADDHGNVRSNATPVALPFNVTAEIDYGDDLDLFRFDAIEGATYIVSTELDSLEDSVLRFLSNSGDVLAQNDDFGFSLSSRIEWVADRTETVFVEVSALLPTDVGSYALVGEAEGIEVVDDHGDDAATATSLAELPTTLVAESNFAGDEDWFRFDAVAGRAYELALASGELAGTTVSVVDSAGQTLDEIELADGEARISWIAPAQDSYFAVVRHEIAGSYELSLSVPYGDANLDGIFNSSDLVTVFIAGGYEDERVGNSDWISGDWNGDGEFTTADLVAAFSQGFYSAA